MDSPSATIATALEHHQRGQLQQAEQIYRQILTTDPNHPDALHLLGVIAQQVGQPAVALELIGRAIQLKGNSAEYHNNLGGVYLTLKRIPDAINSFRNAVTLNPLDAKTRSNLGHALREHGQLDEAVEHCRHAVHLNPDLVDAHVNLGNAFRDQGHLELSVACYQQALDRNPNLAIAHNNMGNALRDQGKLDQAVASFHRALKLTPNFAEAHNNLGNALKDLGQIDAAISHFSRSLELNPNSAETFCNLGNVLVDLNQLDDAIACCQQALQLNPDDAKTHNNLGNALMKLGKSAEAIISYRRAIEINPHDAKVYNNLGGALQTQGKREEAASCHRKALELKPDFAEAHSNVLLGMQYSADVSLAGLYEAHLDFDRRHAIPLQPRNVPAIRQIRDRLRVGFVSADLGRHPVGHFAIRLFEHLHAESVDLICYSDRITKDDLTHRFQQSAAKWCDVIGMTDEQMAERIRTDQVDILVDLAGHTAHNRMLVFARKPAPIQISWMGYEGTTGLSAIDYLIADRHLIPQESEPYYREKVLRMSDGYVCYEPNAFAPAVGPLPLLVNGYPTFGSFNNLYKITPHVIEVWAKILHRLPSSKLILKYRGLGESTVRRRMLDLFSNNGIALDRIELLPESPYAEYLSAYDRIDIGLDTFPFTGGATTCEALWMGVPVVTYQGETFAGRHSSSHLANVGLNEMITTTFDDYIEMAVTLANQSARLKELRSNLRTTMAASSLCDGARFARNFAALLNEVVQYP